MIYLKLMGCNILGSAKMWVEAAERNTHDLMNGTERITWRRAHGWPGLSRKKEDI